MAWRDVPDVPSHISDAGDRSKVAALQRSHSVTLAGAQAWRLSSTVMCSVGAAAA